jgi:hypothetical protein
MRCSSDHPSQVALRPNLYPAWYETVIAPMSSMAESSLDAYDPRSEVEHDAARPLSAISPGVKESRYVHGIFKAGVIVSDFEKTLALLKARNAEIAFGPYPARADQRANVMVRDNAGNLIQFFGK